MKTIWAAIALLITLWSGAAASANNTITIYKTETCGCCGYYVDYLRKNGWEVAVIPVADMTATKKRLGVPEQLGSCHTGMLGNYVVEGHVPVAVLHKLAREKPKIKGIAMPGMPPGSPGMGGTKKVPFTIYAIPTGSEAPKVFAVE